jgi:hypothetical protein
MEIDGEMISSTNLKRKRDCDKIRQVEMLQSIKTNLNFIETELKEKKNYGAKFEALYSLIDEMINDLHYQT